MATDCLEASAEIERFNRNSFAATVSKKRLKSKADAAVSSTAVAAAAAGSEGPMVEYVAFSHDGKVPTFLCCYHLLRTLPLPEGFSYEDGRRFSSIARLEGKGESVFFLSCLR